MDDLLVDFIAETRETLDLLSGEIVAWELDPGDRFRLDAIFRFVHTVKGSCGFLNLPRIERLSHAAEGVLADCRAGRRQPDGALVTAALAIIDRIAELVDALSAGETPPDTDDMPLIAALENRAIDDGAPDGGRSTPSGASARRDVARGIRLPVDLLDRMMAGVSDVVLARNDLARRLSRQGIDSEVEAAFARLSRCVGEMRDAVTRSRMARIDTLFALLPRLARDLAGELGKHVAVATEGDEVEMDREMIEMIRDPLIHILRNAIDHGIEAPADRVAAGKPAAGRITIGARQVGNRIEIAVTDDGRGIDVDRLALKALSTGLVEPAAVAAMDRTAMLELAFLPGLSTAQTVSAISGRGVGMDVVRANIERIGGSVHLESTAGRGVRLVMTVPLTLTIIPALIIVAGGTRFAIARSAVEELVRLREGGAVLGETAGAPFVSLRGNRLPVILLGEFLGLDGNLPPEQRTMMIMRAAGGGHFILAVDAVEDHEELVIKPAAPALMETGLYAGTSLPEEGEPLPLLDPGGIARRAGVAAVVRQADRDATPVNDDQRTDTLLFCDLDGKERALALALVERIDDLRPDDLRPADLSDEGEERAWILRDGKPVRLLSCPRAQAAPRRVLWLSDGAVTIAYAIGEVLDVLPLDHAAATSCGPGFAAAVIAVADRPVELIDPFWLFTRHLPLPGGRSGRDAPFCLLSDGEDGWSRQILVPLLRNAGYRVVTPDSPEAAQARLLILNGHDADGGSETPMLVDERLSAVIRLTNDPARAGPGVVYRYDRDRLLDMLACAASGGGGGS